MQTENCPPSAPLRPKRRKQSSIDIEDEDQLKSQHETNHTSEQDDRVPSTSKANLETTFPVQQKMTGQRQSSQQLPNSSHLNNSDFPDPAASEQLLLQRGTDQRESKKGSQSSHSHSRSNSTKKSPNSPTEEESHEDNQQPCTSASVLLRKSLSNNNNNNTRADTETRGREREREKRKSTSSIRSSKNSIKLRNNSQKRRRSSLRKSSSRLSQQIINFSAFDSFQKLKSVSMSLDWIHFKICSGEDETELFQAVQSKYCSLSVTNSNEIFVRRPNAENVLRIHSSIVEDVRNFDFYTGCEKYIGSLICDARQTFKLPCKIENRLTGEVYNVTVQRDGEVKFWEIAFVPDNLPIANVKVHIGHRWKSVYKLTFLEEISISSQILLLGFLLSLASARLESEILPGFLAVSAILVTFIIFFIIQFT